MYVDDIIVIGSHPMAVDSIIKLLKTDFAMQDLGNLNYFLGVKTIPPMASTCSLFAHTRELFDYPVEK
jgi:hypothetical protein